MVGREEVVSRGDASVAAREADERGHCRVSGGCRIRGTRFKMMQVVKLLLLQ